MLKPYFVQRGNKKYAYISTSVYDKDTKKPVPKVEYIGILNEKTNEIIPKKRHLTDKISLNLKDVSCRRFGGSYVLFKFAEELGLREDLFNSYGLDGDKILACSIAQVLSGTPLSSTEDEIEGSMIRELLGIQHSFESPRMSELTANLGTNYGGLEALFEKRLRRAGKVLSYDLTSTSTYSTINGWGEFGYNRDREKHMRQMNIGLVTDKEGIPVMFEIYPGSISDVTTLKRTVDRVNELKGEECTLVMDRIFGSASNLQYLIDNDIPFIMPGNESTKAVKALFSTIIKKINNPDFIRIHGGVAYTVMEAEVVVVPKLRSSKKTKDETETSDDYELIIDDDSRFSSVPESKRIKAYVCYDGKKASDETNNLMKKIDVIEKKLREANPFAVMRNVKKFAGSYANYFDLKIVDNKLQIERKKNAISYAINRSGLFVMLTKGIESWEEMMQCYDCRVYVEQAFDALKNELDGNRWRVNNIESAKGRLVLKFIALILWMKIASILRKVKIHETVRSTLQSLDNVMAVGNNDEWRVNEITKRNRELFQHFNIEHPPDRLVLPNKQYIPPSLLDKFKNDFEGS